MANEMRDRLVELLVVIFQPGQKTLGDIADHLIENGVVVPPCKMGQTVYVIRFNEETRWIEEYLVKYFYSSSKGIDRIYAQCGTDSRNFRPRHFGKSVFLTKEQAEQKLKEMRDDTNA